MCGISSKEFLEIANIGKIDYFFKDSNPKNEVYTLMIFDYFLPLS